MSQSTLLVLIGGFNLFVLGQESMLTFLGNIYFPKNNKLKKVCSVARNCTKMRKQLRYFQAKLCSKTITIEIAYSYSFCFTLSKI